MEGYEEVSDLIQKFKKDTYVLNCYKRIYELNKCKSYRSITIKDIQNKIYYKKEKNIKKKKNEDEKEDENEDVNEDVNEDQNEDVNEDVNEDQNEDQNEDEKEDVNEDQNEDQNDDQDDDRDQNDKKEYYYNIELNARTLGRETSKDKIHTLHENNNDVMKNILKSIDNKLYKYTNEVLEYFDGQDKETLNTNYKINNCIEAHLYIDNILITNQHDIKYICKDINNIEKLTQSINNKLTNRKIILELLNTYIKIIIITPQLITNIIYGDINQEFIKNIHILTNKIENCKHCLYDIYPSIKYSYIELEKLKKKSVDRIYFFFLEKINNIKNKNTHIYIIQQNLLTFFELNTFLFNNNRHVYNYLLNEYIHVMNKKYFHLFKNYITNMEKKIKNNKNCTFINNPIVGFTNNYHSQIERNVNNNVSVNRNRNINSININNVDMNNVDMNSISINNININNININNININNNNNNIIYNNSSSNNHLDIISSNINNVTFQNAKKTMMNFLGFNPKNENTCSNTYEEPDENIFSLNGRHKVLYDMCYFNRTKEEKKNDININDNGNNNNNNNNDNIIINNYIKNYNRINDEQTFEDKINKEYPVSLISDLDNLIYPFEEIYKSINKLFLDTGSLEYYFILNFYKDYESPDFLFLEIYSKTISLCFDFIYYYTIQTYDVISLYCVYIMNLYYAYIMYKRNIITLYVYIQRIQTFLWDKIYYIVQENLDSLNKKRLDEKKYVSLNLNAKININQLEQYQNKTCHMNNWTFDKCDNSINVHSNNYKNEDKNIDNQSNNVDNQNKNIDNQSNNVDNQNKNIENQSNNVDNQNKNIDNQSNNIDNQGNNIDNQSNNIDNQSNNIDNQSNNVDNHYNYCMNENIELTNNLGIYKTQANKNTHLVKIKKNDINNKHMNTHLNNQEERKDSLHFSSIIKTQEVHSVTKKITDFYSSVVILSNLCFNIDTYYKEKIDKQKGKVGHQEEKLKENKNQHLMNMKEEVDKIEMDRKNYNDQKGCNLLDGEGDKNKLSNGQFKEDIIMENSFDKNVNFVKDNEGIEKKKHNNCNDDKIGNNNNNNNNNNICAHSNENSYLNKIYDENVSMGDKLKNDKEVNNTSISDKNNYFLKYKKINDLISKFEGAIIDTLISIDNELVCPKEKLLFLINNYYYIIYILKQNKLQEKICTFEKLLKKEIATYIEYELNIYIKDIISFVNKHENIINTIKEDTYNKNIKNNKNYDDQNYYLSLIDIISMENIAIQFTKNWKLLFKNIRNNIITSFINIDNAFNILKLLNTQILLYFTRFYRLTKKIFSNIQPPLYIQNLPSVDVIMIQIKKYTKNVGT
ncbi:vacuolar protein sorting-associated protein 52, putative [Plasmodium reichenowi]|uniref:Vacuolar protein sorting-associated protein 52, putative n=1 Tax=Plasmodium reichenowi TaxID=5854 RepID=A0A2P9DLH8_PLARE|nr:vacuolar protein sorting-associated protein 52, putative [Plasmodium reichenowi]